MRLPRPIPLRLPAAALMLAALAAAAACSAGDPAALGRPETVPVTVGVVERKDVPVQVEQIGAVEAYSTVAVKAQIGGELREVHFKEGQEVRRGDLLFTIDPRPHQAAVQSAEAALARDTVLLQNAREEFERYIDLVKKDYVTPEDYDRKRATAAALEAAVRADQAAVENARLQLGYCTIRSPIDGRTGRLLEHRGNLVKANADEPLVVINQITPVYVAFSVPEQNLARIKARQAERPLQARAVIPGDQGGPITGTLTFLNNEVDGATGTFLLKATFPNEDRRLWPGQFVNVTLDLDVTPNALVVPSEAIQTGQQGPFVFVVKPDMTVESRPVAVRGIHQHETLVEGGVEAGESVVTDGQIRLVPGSLVEVKTGAGAVKNP